MNRLLRYAWLFITLAALPNEIACDTCTHVFDSINFCFNGRSSTSVTLTCPENYVVRLRNATVYASVTSDVCSSNLAPANVCNLQADTLMTSLLSACALRQSCSAIATLPLITPTSCLGAVGPIFAQMYYRCEALQNINYTARALAMDSNRSFTGALVNIDSTPLALSGRYITNTGGQCWLTVPPNTEFYISPSVFIKPTTSSSCGDQYIGVTSLEGVASYAKLCSMGGPAAIYPCQPTTQTYLINYNTFDDTVPVIFTVQIYVKYLATVQIFCGYLPDKTPPVNISTPPSNIISTTTDQGFPLPYIILIIVGCCLAVIVIVICCCVCCSMRRKRRQAKKQLVTPNRAPNVIVVDTRREAVYDGAGRRVRGSLYGSSAASLADDVITGRGPGWPQQQQLYGWRPALDAGRAGLRGNAGHVSSVGLSSLPAFQSNLVDVRPLAYREFPTSIIDTSPPQQPPIIIREYATPLPPPPPPPPPQQPIIIRDYPTPPQQPIIIRRQASMPNLVNMNEYYNSQPQDVVLNHASPNNGYATTIMIGGGVGDTSHAYAQLQPASLPVNQPPTIHQASFHHSHHHHHQQHPHHVTSPQAPNYSSVIQIS